MTAPTISAGSPPAGPLAANSRVSFSVTSTPALARVMIFVQFPGAGFMEVVWDGSAFASAYTRNAIRTVIADGFSFEFIREPIWPDSLTVHVYAINTSAEESTASITWALAEPAGITASGALPVFPISAPSAGADSEAPVHDQAYYLAVGEKLVDPDYIAGMKNGSGAGYELFQAAAKIAERASLAVQNMEIGSLMVFAQGGARATGTVELYRDAASAGAVVVKAGSVVGAGSRLFFTLDDVSFGGSDLGPHAVRITSIYQGYAYNVPGRVVTPRGETINGEISSIRRLLQVPAFGDPTIRVRQINPTQGGRDPDLDLLGRDRGIERGTGESDDHYRLRMRSLPDTITPGAIRRAAKNVLRKYGVGFQYIETTDYSYSGCYDAPTGVPDVFVYDDPRAITPFRNRWLDAVEQYHAFIIVADRIQPVSDRGGMYDDTLLGGADSGSPVSRGRRGVAAYDHSSTDPGVVAGRYVDIAYDGRDYQLDAVYAALYKQLQATKAAGISAILEKAGS